MKNKCPLILVLLFAVLGNTAWCQGDYYTNNNLIICLYDSAGHKIDFDTLHGSANYSEMCDCGKHVTVFNFISESPDGYQVRYGSSFTNCISVKKAGQERGFAQPLLNNLPGVRGKEIVLSFFCCNEPASHTVSFTILHGKDTMQVEISGIYFNQCCRNFKLDHLVFKKGKYTLNATDILSRRYNGKVMDGYFVFDNPSDEMSIIDISPF